MHILVLKHDRHPAYAQAFDSEQAAACHPGSILARIDSPADAERYLTEHAFGGPIKAYHHVERIARDIGWIEPDILPDASQPRPQLLLPLC